MTSVFVVTDGQYSDYHIVAIFATKEEAEAFTNGAVGSKSRSGYESDVDIVEWLLGPPKDDSDEYRPTWQVWVDLETGDLSKEQFTLAGNCEHQRHPERWSDSGLHIIPGHYRLAWGASTVSEEHALKVAAEARQAYLREAGSPVPA